MSDELTQPVPEAHPVAAEISQSAIRSAAAAVREVTASKLAEMADQMFGRPNLDDDPAGWSSWAPDRTTREGRARAAEWHLLKIRISLAADVDPLGDALNARKCGASWASIGAACGTSRQAAHDRWAALL